MFENSIFFSGSTQKTETERCQPVVMSEEKIKAKNSD